MFGSILGWFRFRAQQQMDALIDRHSELVRWLAVRDEIRRRMDKERTVLGAIEQQRQRVLSRIEELKKEIAAHMERKP
jgi:hypothetical protein